MSGEVADGFGSEAGGFFADGGVDEGDVISGVEDARKRLADAGGDGGDVIGDGGFQLRVGHLSEGDVVVGEGGDSDYVDFEAGGGVADDKGGMSRLMATVSGSAIRVDAIAARRIGMVRSFRGWGIEFGELVPPT